MYSIKNLIFYCVFFGTRFWNSGVYFTLRCISVQTSHISNAQEPQVASGCCISLILTQGWTHNKYCRKMDSFMLLLTWAMEKKRLNFQTQ